MNNAFAAGLLKTGGDFFTATILGDDCSLGIHKKFRIVVGVIADY